MTKAILLDQLKEFTEASVKDLIMPVRGSQENPYPDLRAAWVFLCGLPEFRADTEKAPYILHQVVTGKDYYQIGNRLASQAVVRTVFCVYSEDRQEGGLMLLNLMERVRIAFQEQGVIGKQFVLDKEAGLETLVYPDNGIEPTEPYYLGELFSVWHYYGIERTGIYDKEGHGHIRKDEFDRR